MRSETTVILCAGPINYSHLPISTNQSNAMVPINGQPVIGWILDDLIQKGIRQATVVLREEDHPLRRFLERAYMDRLALGIAVALPGGSIVQSLLAGLEASPHSDSVRVVLGDTLIRDSYAAEEDFVYVGEVEEARRWCLAVVSPDSYVVDYIDKQEYGAPRKIALAGYYHFLDRRSLQECALQSAANDERELSFVLRRYGISHPLKARWAKEWYDFGHIDNLTAARQRLLRPRYFNKLSINPVLNTITKISENSQKLQDELDWYLEIPAELQVLAPRVLSYRRVDGHLHVIQEYYGYPTLAELYLYSDIDVETWSSILRRVMRIHKEFRRHSSRLTQEEILAMYVGKTDHRLAAMRRQEQFWNEMLDRRQISFNGRALRNVCILDSEIQRRAKMLAETASVHIIHGDFCFSNILLDVNNQIIRVIDPRGRFGRKGIYGDPRYDIAKLRHSVSGMYDFIVADMFEVVERNGGFEGRVYADGRTEKVAANFDVMLIEAGYDLDEIRLIEGLQFISMPPFHRDHPKRQLMMYLTGLSLLNEVIPCAS